MSAISKKRKRVSSLDGNAVAFQISKQDRSGVGPVLFTSPGFESPGSTAFQMYGRKPKKRNVDADVEEDNTDVMIAGEAPSVEFYSSFDGEGKDIGCRYLLGLYRKSSHTVHLFAPTSQSKTPSVHILKHAVKALKSQPSPPPLTLPYMEARNALGETFGTKKAKAQIRAREKQKVDVSAVKGSVSHIVEGIEKGVKGLVNKEEAQDVADAARLIPPYSKTATDPEGVYPLHDIIPESEWKALQASVAPVIQLGYGSRPKEREAILPYKRSLWVNQHLGRLVTQDGLQGLEGKEGKRKLRILYYVSALFAFRQVVEYIRSGLEKDELQDKLKGLPNIILDGLVTRFTEVQRGSTKHVSTTAMQTKLRTYMFALCLRVDNWATDTTLLANDLSQNVTVINQLFRSLGCKITAMTDRELAKLGLPVSAKDTKRAVLSAPVVFPKPKAGKRR